MRFNFPSSPADGQTHKIGTTTYEYNAADSSWEAVRSTITADLSESRARQLIAAEFDGASGFRDLYLSGLEVYVDANGVANPPNPELGVSSVSNRFDLIESVISWAKSKRLRGNVTLTINLVGVNHYVYSPVVLKIPGVSRIVIKGTAPGFTAQSFKATVVATSAVNTAAQKDSLRSSMSAQLAATKLIFKSAGRFAAGSNLEYLEITNLSIIREFSVVRASSFIDAGGIVSVRVRNCFIDSLSPLSTNNYLVTSNDESLGSYINIVNCVCIDSPLALIEGGSVEIEKVSAIGSGLSIVGAKQSNVKLREFAVSRASNPVDFRSCSVYSETVDIYYPVAGYTLYAEACQLALSNTSFGYSTLGNFRTWGCIVNWSGGRVEGATGGFGIEILNGTANLSGLVVESNNSNSGLPSGARCGNSQVCFLSCTFTNNNGGGVYIAGASSVSAQSTTATYSQAMDSIAIAGMLNSVF